jgi:hypothetical protein
MNKNNLLIFIYWYRHIIFQYKYFFKETTLHKEVFFDKLVSIFVVLLSMSFKS